MLLVCVPALLTSTASAQQADSLQVQQLAQNQFSGAASVEALAQLLHQALQQNDFNLIAKHLPDQQAYDQLFLMGTAPTRIALADYMPAQVQQAMHRNFERLLTEALVQETDWAQTKMGHLAYDNSAPLHADAIPVQMTLSAPYKEPLTILFHVGRLENQYFLLPPLQIISQDMWPEEYR